MSSSATLAGAVGSGLVWFGLVASVQPETYSRWKSSRSNWLSNDFPLR